ncbi:hypothetical protein VWZ88_12570 [Phaeobacter sp. JH20_36]|uniref:hypothetical protein n=1 Tax=unclassified Phaeobacter TaxID=2621772 RepID=UPI003A8859B1
MNTPAPIQKRKATPAKPRISKKLRAAIDLYTTQRITKQSAAEQVGLAPSYLYSSLNKPHVRDYEQERFAQYIQDIEELKAPYKAEAFETAAELMRTAKSEAVRARMVEFLAGERKGNAVNVAVQVNNQAPTGYEYARPDQEVVVIRAGGDTQSPAEDSE